MEESLKERLYAKCREEALKYSSLREWYKSSIYTYRCALRNGWKKELSKHMIKERIRRSEMTQKEWIEGCKEEALKYANRTEWSKKSHWSYNYARENGLLDICTKHHDKKNESWNKKKIREIAHLYKSKKEWRECDEKSYRASFYLKINKECTVHMPKYSK